MLLYMGSVPKIEGTTVQNRKTGSYRNMAVIISVAIILCDLLLHIQQAFAKWHTKTTWWRQHLIVQMTVFCLMPAIMLSHTLHLPILHGRESSAKGIMPIIRWNSHCSTVVCRCVFTSAHCHQAQHVTCRKLETLMKLKIL